MDWIKSGGGPLICIERELATCWRGVAETAGGIDASVETMSDYDRACQIRDYLGTLDVRKGHALILGDMPLETSVWNDERGGAFIVRLFYIDPGQDVPQILRKIDDCWFNDPDEAISFEAISGHMVIFDSAYPGVEQKKKNLLFEISPAKYRVLSKVINPNSRTSILLHKFCVIM